MPSSVIHKEGRHRKEKAVDWRLTLEFAHFHVLQAAFYSEKDGRSFSERCFVTGRMRLRKFPNIDRLQKESYDGQE